jgi:hypothetical protein
MITADMNPADEARFAAALQKLAALSDEPVEDILRQQGRLFAIDMARITERFGDKPISGKKHKRDIEITIKSIYKNPLSIAKLVSRNFGEASGRKFRNWISKGEFTKAQAMLDRSNIAAAYFKSRRITIGTFDGGAMHERFRFKGGRDILIVSNYKDVKKYITKMKLKAGIAKAGWAAAARDLGGTGKLPVYITKRHKKRGHGSVKGKKGKATLTVRNRVRYVQEVMFRGGEWSIWKDRIGKMENSIARTIKRRQAKLKRKYKL